MTAGVATTAVANGILNALRAGGTTLTVVAGTYAQLHVGDPGAAGTANTAVGSTTRVAFTQAAASSGSSSINGTLPAWTNGGTSETITHMSVWTASTSGTFLYSFALTTPQAWASTNVLTLTSFSVAVTPLAA